MSRPICAAFGNERELGRLHELELARVVTEETEVVHGIAVHGRELDFLLIEEYGLRAYRPRRHDVPVRQNEAALGVDDETRRLARLVALGVERARAVDLDGHDAGGDTLQRAIPALLLCRDGAGRYTQGAEQRPEGQNSNLGHSGGFYACELRA